MPADVRAAVRLWLMCRKWGSGGIGGAAVLPGGGGLGDQPAALIDAFALLDRMLENDNAR